MKIYLTMLVAVASSTSTFASDINNCKSFSNDEKRLSCYDEATDYSPQKTASTDTGATSNEDGEKWQFVERRDEFENTNTSLVALPSDMVNVSFTDAPQEIIIRCDGKGSSDVLVMSGGYIGGNKPVSVRYKFGSNDPITERWLPSTTGKSAFLPSGYKDFIAGILTGEDFLFELTDYRGSKYRAKFDNSLNGKKHLDFVLSGCPSD